LEGYKDPSELHCADPDGFPAAWRKALEAAEPLDLAGAAVPEAPPWPDPLPLPEAPPAEPFPLEVLPESVQRFVREGAGALPLPPDSRGAPFRVAAGGAIGASRALAVKQGHVQRAALYAASIGPPGSAKSPALDLAVEPAHEAEERLRPDWED